MAFSGADFANPDKFITYREQIWICLENMIDTDELKTVHQVWAELEYNDPDSCKRLAPRRDHFIIPTDHDTDIFIINIISKYPKLVDHRLHYTREPADPYLVAYAKKWNVPIISDEKPLQQRIGKRKSRHITIPDVCQLETDMTCMLLEEFLKSKEVIPSSFK